MKFSIVTISYNQARFLEQAIRSVIEQDYPDVEYIVVDPGSTDGSREIIERYRDRIDRIIFEPDNGPADGLNKGFAQATGDIYGYINSDDALLAGALTKVAQAFRERPKADVVCGHLYQVDDRLTLIRRLRASKFTPERFVYGGVQVAQQSTFIRGAAFKKVGGFNEANRTSWDAELLLDISLGGGKVEIIEAYLAIFRIHGNSITGSQTLARESRKNHDRYFSKVRGRSRKKVDALLRWRYRIAKWCSDPRGFVARSYDAFVTPHWPIVIDLAKKDMSERQALLRRRPRP